MRRVAPRLDNATIGETEDAIGDFCDNGIVRDKGSGRSEFPIDPENSLEHKDAGLAV